MHKEYPPYSIPASSKEKPLRFSGRRADTAVKLHRGGSTGFPPCLERTPGEGIYPGRAVFHDPEEG